MDGVVGLELGLGIGDMEGRVGLDWAWAQIWAGTQDVSSDPSLQVEDGIGGPTRLGKGLVVVPCCGEGRVMQSHQVQLEHRMCGQAELGVWIWHGLYFVLIFNFVTKTA